MVATYVAGIAPPSTLPRVRFVDFEMAASRHLTRRTVDAHRLF